MLILSMILDGRLSLADCSRVGRRRWRQRRFPFLALQRTNRFAFRSCILHAHSFVQFGCNRTLSQSILAAISVRFFLCIALSILQYTHLPVSFCSVRLHLNYVCFVGTNVQFLARQTICIPSSHYTLLFVTSISVRLQPNFVNERMSGQHPSLDNL